MGRRCRRCHRLLGSPTMAVVVGWSWSWVLMVFVVLISPPSPTSRSYTTVVAAAEVTSDSQGTAGGKIGYFNFEVEKRILERLDFYLGGPINVNDIISNFQKNGGFPNDMKAPDRDLYLSLAYSLPQPLVYYGLEDGTCVGYYWSNGYYREPGNAGYDVVNNPVMEKHLTSCIDNDTGEPTLCLLQPGSSYISCKDGLGDETGICERMELCPNQEKEIEAAAASGIGGAQCDDGGLAGGGVDINNSTTTTTSTSTIDCSSSTSNLKWCRQYSIKVAEAIEVVEEEEGGDTTTTTTTTTTTRTSGKGFVPLTNMCISSKGKFAQSPIPVIDPLGSSRDVTTTQMTTCRYANGEIVDRSLEGSYAACRGNSNNNNNEEDENAIICDDVFNGGYESWEYDPRYRPWYILTKEYQKSHWLKPYVFFSLAIGVTYTTPIYSIDEITGRQVFAGVVAVDYRFVDIARFLLESYGNSSSSVAIYEDEPPHYLIGTSTGIESANFMLTEDLTQPCPVDRGDAVPCTPVRVSVLDIGNSEMGDDDDDDEEEKEDANTTTTTTTTTTATTYDPMDRILARAAERHIEANYPQNLLSLKGSDDIVNSQVYVSQSTLYIQPGAELTWRIIVVSEGATSETDAITLNNNPSLVVGITVVGALGVLTCLAFLYIMYQKRGEKAIVFADWRFTSAFIFGCILLNGSTFTLLGENTDTMCLLRLWTFHLFVVMALSPLLVKVWRIYQLVGLTNLRRSTISNSQAGTYTLPMIVVQIAILLVFTFVDPPRQMEIIEEEGGLVLQRIVCGNDSDALFYALGAYEGIFVLVGCFLAYLTRKLKNDFGEAKQLIFSMYNIAFVGIMVVVIVQVAGLDGNGRNMMQAVGVFWGTIFSTGAFVIPRLLQVQQRQRENDASGRGSGLANVKVSGVRISGLSTPPQSVVVPASSDFDGGTDSRGGRGGPSFAGYTAPLNYVDEMDDRGDIPTSGEVSHPQNKQRVARMDDSLSSSNNNNLSNPSLSNLEHARSNGKDDEEESQQRQGSVSSSVRIDMTGSIN